MVFPFDRNALPQLPTRKALMVIDFQNDFLSADGALPVMDRDDLVSRTLNLVKAFRRVGDIVWVCTEFDKPRVAAAEQILATDVLPKPTILASRLRRQTAAPDDEVNVDADPEAFLSRPGPPVVYPATSGSQFPAAVKEALAPRDIAFVKSHYSAFKSGQLLQMLRVKFITQLYLCGSLANVGVYATAVDAAKYGYAITLIEDCCGYISDLRQSNAMRSLVDVTGCEMEDSPATMEKLLPKIAPAPSTPASPSSVVPKRVAESDGGKAASASDVPKTKSLEESMAELELDSGGPSAVKPKKPCEITVNSECAVPSDMLEVDPDAQPPPEPPNSCDSAQTEASGEKLAEAVSSESAVERQCAPATEKDAMQEPRILKPATRVNSSTSDSDLEPDSKSVAAETQATATDGEPNEPPRATEPLCEGDTTIIHNVLPKPLANGIFDKIRGEVCWQRMLHQGGEVPRLVAVQGEVASDGSMPVYRHPSDESPPLLPFSPTVLKVKTEVEKQLGHPLNHALIQFYRDGTDYISEHSDKTLDIVKGSYIANVSLGAERTMVFRTKRREKDPLRTDLPPGEDSKHRKISRAKLPHNSLCSMGLKTNMRWLHAIRQEKRMDREKTPAELAFSGGRISLTFRQIGTFLDRESTLIWGQGATAKTRDMAHLVVNGQSLQAVAMLQAFGIENHSTDCDWDRHYGEGFDVLHMSNSPRLCLSADPVVNMRIALMLAEYGISYIKGTMFSSFNWKHRNSGAEGTPAAPETVKFVDNDTDNSTVQGELAIMLYLDRVHGSDKSHAAINLRPDLARILNRFQQGFALLNKWRLLERDDMGKRDLKLLRKELAVWDGFAAETDFIAGPSISLADFAVWPVLHFLVDEHGIDVLAASGKLKEYYEMVKVRESTIKVLNTIQVV